MIEIAMMMVVMVMTLHHIAHLRQSVQLFQYDLPTNDNNDDDDNDDDEDGSDDVSLHTLIDVQYVPTDDVQLDRVLFVSS